MGISVQKIGLCVLMLSLGGCGYVSSLVMPAQKVGVVLWDDRPVDQDYQDTRINVQLRQELIKADIKLGADVEVTVFKGKVLLTGALPSLDVINQVIEKAWQTPDVVCVYNYIRVDKPLPLLDVQEDAGISAFIRTQLSLTKNVKSANYKIVVENHVLYMMGQSRSNQEYTDVMNVIRNTAGISKVITLLDGPTTYLEDDRVW